MFRALIERWHIGRSPCFDVSYYTVACSGPLEKHNSVQCSSLVLMHFWNENWICFCMSEAERKLEPFEWQLGCRRSSPPRWCRGSKLGDLSPTTRAVPAAPRVGAPASVPISLLPFCGLAWRRSKAAAALASQLNAQNASNTLWALSILCGRYSADASDHAAPSHGELFPHPTGGLNRKQY